MLLADPGLWRTDEVLREMSNSIIAEDSLARLYASGLIHRLEGFVFPTRAATRASALGGYATRSESQRAGGVEA